MDGWRSKVLLKFSVNPHDTWTVDDAMKGTSILGGTGSGKTSASGKTIAMQFLKEGWGGIVLCAKRDEAKDWYEYCKKANRTKDVIWFKKGAVRTDEGKFKGRKMVFNPLHYEMSREGEGAKEAFNITNIFMNMNKISNRVSNEPESNKGERFWDSALKRILNRTIELINLAGENLTYANMVNLIYTAPTEKRPFDIELWDAYCDSLNYNNYNEFVDTCYEKQEDRTLMKMSLQNNYFTMCMAKAHSKIIDVDIDDESTITKEFLAYDQIYKYFTSSLPNMSEQTHNSIIESFMGLAEPFLSGVLSEHFAGETTVYPEEVYTDNKIILLDFPVKEFLEAGVMAQSIFKMIFQQSVERREVDKYPNPAFIWADEAQYFINPYDQIFLTTARSSRTATVFLSQNISNYIVTMGGDKAMPQVHSLMGNLATKIFHANSDAKTNEYSSQLIGQSISLLSGTGASRTFLSFNFSSSKSINSQLLPQVQPKEFTTLRSGGETNGYLVDAIVFATGKKWSSGTNFIRTIFKQNFS